MLWVREGILSRCRLGRKRVFQNEGKEQLTQRHPLP